MIYFENSFKPTIPAIIRNMQIILATSRDSPKKIMPIMAVPAAPIPVHMA